MLARIAGLALLAFVGCGRQREDLERGRVLAAIDALRDEPSADAIRRRGLLAELEQQPAIAPAAKAARDKCASAYGYYLDGNDLVADMQRAIARGEPPPADADQKLENAETDLAQAKMQMPDCERALADLRRPTAPRALP